MSKKFGSKHSDPTVKEVVPTDSDEEITDSDMEEEEEFDLIEAMNDMSVGERKKVYALKGITAEYKKLRQQYFDELAAMELKALAVENAIAEERRKIVTGAREATAEEIEKGTDKTESGVEEIPSDDEDDKKPRKGVKVVTPAEKKSAEEAASKGGVPRFWLSAFKNSEVLDSMIIERDEEALAALEDVRMSYVDDNFKKGFKVTFHFGENEFFENKELSKTFLMDEDDDDEDGGALEQTIGTEIDWKSPEKNLTVIIKQKKQRHKSGKGIRIVNKEEKVPSFFNFFRTPEEPESDCEDDEEIEMFQEQMEMDFEAGMALRSGIVYRPAHYFSGKSVEAVAAQLREQFGFGMEDDEEEEEEEETDEESEDDEPPQRAGGRGRGGKGPAPKPGGKQDCKQQ